MDEVQIHLNTLAFDQINDPDIFAGIAASSAVAISDIPFITPTAHVRVGRVDGKLILNPTFEEVETGDLDLVVAGTKHFVNMIEVGSKEVLEDDVADAIEFGHKAIVEIVAMIEELQGKVGLPKVGNVKQPDPAFVDAIKSKVTDKIREVKGKPANKTDPMPSKRSSKISSPKWRQARPIQTLRTCRSSKPRQNKNRFARCSSKSKNTSPARPFSPACVPTALVHRYPADQL